MNAERRETSAVVFSQWIYRRLLAAYPRAHREEYGAAMAQLFRDQCRDAWNWRRGWGLALLWLRVLPELLKTSVWERLTNTNKGKFMFKNIFMRARSGPALLGMFISVFMAVFLLTVITATTITFILPEAYASRARIKMERDVTDVPPVTGQPSMTGVYDPYFIQTEFEVIQSEKILDQVAERLDLNTVWAKKYNSDTKLKSSESRNLLKRMIDLRPARNTSLIDITVFSDDKQEAKRIANTIAEVYASYRRDQREQLLAGSQGEYKKLTEELKRELADKTDDSKAVDAKIAATLARAGQVYQTSNAGAQTWRVEIIEHAEAGLRPVRPNKPLNIAIGIVIGAVLGFFISGAVVIVSARMSRKAPAAA